MERECFIFQGKYKNIIDSLPEKEQLREYRNFIDLMLRREQDNPFSGISHKLFNAIDGDAGEEVPAEIQDDFISGGFVVAPWMLKAGLKGNDLIVFAQVYSRTVRHKGYYRNNGVQIAYETGISQQAVYKSVNNLIEKGFLFRNGQIVAADLEKIRKQKAFQAISLHS